MDTKSRQLGRSETADRQILVWRRRQLTNAGFSLSQASALARDSRTNLHALIDLVDHGCPPELAARILAPIEGEHTA